MFDFGNANDAQKQAIETTDGPVLITAGPGTGKTFTLVQRAIYLIQEKGVRPEEIMLATFTEKAAKELITRITNELAARGIVANINEMYIGTFHSLCLRIIKEHLELTRLKKNFRTLDQFDQSYTVFQNIYRFRGIQHFDTVVSSQGAWKQAGEICGFVNNLSEELIDPADLMADNDIRIAALGEILKVYQEVLAENNLMDFSAIQTEAYWLLTNYPEVLAELRAKIHYIMIDEYQDTNYIQEQLVFLFGGKHQNICVVGDDDQGLYRFRGATIRNILEFPQKFPDGVCRIIPLVINYRSNSDIVDFYNQWMITTDGARFRFRWRNFRYDKTIEPHVQTALHSPAVVKLASVNDEDEWHEKILSFIKGLVASGKLTDYNQIAFLFNSVKHQRVTSLARFLESNGINVYSPRSDMFFQRQEIRLMLGCLMLMFPKYVQGLENQEYPYMQPEHYRYYRGCVEEANKYLSTPEAADFRNWIRRRGKLHFSLREATDYGYSGLVYQMFEFSPFSDILSTEMDVGLVDLRPARNIAMFTQVINKFEYLHRVSVLDPALYQGKRRVDVNTETLFNLYLRLLYDGGISEYEDDAEYAPSGCVSFLTIHQSKGMEFPIVVVDSLGNIPRRNTSDLMEIVERKYFKRPAFEPYADMKFFDFWRLYYTAFSRAQNLLVLTCNEDRRTPSMYFREVYSELADMESDEFDINEFTFSTVKDVNLKDTFSFTSHISVYETCAVQYKLYRELQFTPVRVSAMLFGMLVHQTIEDIIYIIPDDELFAKWKRDEAFIDDYGRLMNRKPHRVLKELKHYVDNTPMVQQRTSAPPVVPVRNSSPVKEYIKDSVRETAMEATEIIVDRAVDAFFYEVLPNVWYKHIVPFYHRTKEALTSREQKADVVLAQTKTSTDVAVKQSKGGTRMTQEEADAEKRKVLYHWLGMLSSLKKLHDAGEMDFDSTLAQLTDPAMLKRVNNFLSENPNLLETDKYLVLHGLLGRDLYEEQQLVPIRAAEITQIAARYGYDARNDETEDDQNG